MPDARNPDDHSETLPASPADLQDRCAECGVALQPVAQRAAAMVPDDEAFSQLLCDAKSSLPRPWRHVLDSMNEGLLLVTSERRVAYLNQRAERMIGRSLEDVQGQLCTDAINCPQCSCACLLFERGGVEAVEVTIHAAPDAAPRVLQKNARLLHDPQGKVVGGVETFSEIGWESRSRRAAPRLASVPSKDKALSDTALDVLEEGVFTMDASRRVVRCTDRCARMLGLAGAGAALGRDVAELLGVVPGFLGASHDVDGRTFVVALGGPAKRQTAALSFRRTRLHDDETLGVLRWTDDGRGLEAPVDHPDRFQDIISRSPRMWDVFRVIECVAHNQANVLIEGESGVGKDLVARAIHQLGARRDAPFYAVNCAAFTGDLFLNELFGHERGAFTGAVHTTAGKLEMAGNGTLFLDEVSEIPIQHQAVLLRVLEARRFERVGGRKPIEMGARIISATNRRLCEAVQAKEFRNDLYFRLRVIPIQVPPLRERTEDIPLLAEHFAAQAHANRTGGRVRFTNAALEALTRYPWPGNVRELRNLVEYFCSVSPSTVDLEHLPLEIRRAQPGPGSPAVAAPVSSRAQSDAECRAKLLDALRATQFRKHEAARLLGIDRTTLWRQMKRFGI